MHTSRSTRALATVAALSFGAVSIAAVSLGSTTASAASKTHTKKARSTKPLPATKTIAEVAAGNKQFSTLVTALSAAGLVDTLKGAGPFTVFAPTNDAFAKLPAGTVEALLADKKKLTDILTYHVIAGKVPAATVVTLNGKSAKTVNGAEIAIAVANGKVTLNKTVTVVTTDIAASNGIIHVIDTVLLPPVPTPAPAPTSPAPAAPAPAAPAPAAAAPAAPAPATPAPAANSNARTIVDVASANPDFSTLVAAVKAAGLVETLQGPGPFTVFAPTNLAFTLLGKDTVNNLLKPENKRQLADVLTYHVVAGKNLAKDVVKVHSLKTVNGRTIQIAQRDGGVFVNSARVQATDIETSNGVIHVIDTALLP